jgi:beta-galactosidase GanA
MKTWYILILAAGALVMAAPPPNPRVLVLEDFEAQSATGRWEGPLAISPEHASHGYHSGRISLDSAHPEFSSGKLATDWSGYERLLFDLYSEREGNSAASIRIVDATSARGGEPAKEDYFEASNKVFFQKGWNHVEVKLTSMKAASFLRDIDLHNIRRLTLSFNAARLPITLWADNFRLVAGEETGKTASHVQPQDILCQLDNRWVTVRQIARPEDVPEAPAVTRLRKQAETEADLLRHAIEAAQVQGIEVRYSERRLIIAVLALRIRPLLAWFNNDEKKTEMFQYVADTCRAERRAVEDSIRSTTLREEVDDTLAADSIFRPFPPLKGRPIKDGFFRDDGGDPMMILSLHSPSSALQRFFATPRQHIESYSVGGGSHWTIDESPVYAAFHQDPDTHRVGWDGWCGHLVRDLSSMGGTKKENVVICLESPRIRSAVKEYIRINTPKLHSNRELLYDIMAYELMYICYCDRSQRMFHQWLATKYGGVDKANECWGTKYANFDEVVPPPVKNSRPLANTNRALWYDWARFNQDRFTDYLLWVRGEIQKIDPTTPLAAGGSSSMLAGRTGTTGIDEERIVNEVDDVIIHEGSGSTMGMDLQLALSEKRKPLADPEMSLDRAESLLPHYLHGKSVSQLFHWPAQPSNEFLSVIRSSLAHSWAFSLEAVDEVLRVALDVRRLNKEIASFATAPAEAAILYSQTSTLQLPPEMLTAQTTPYLAELRRAYEASEYLDAKVTFITERQIVKGWLSRYKLLIVPGARNVPPQVVEAIWNYASEGGRVLVLPESLLGDEYNRPRNYLSHIGISVRETSRPQIGGRGRMTQGYDQSLSQTIRYTSGGIRQTIDVNPGGAKLPRFPDVVRRPLGRGIVDYSPVTLDEATYAGVLETLFEEAGVHRPIRVRAACGEKGKIEARFVQAGSRKLVYVINYNSTPSSLEVEKAGNLRELREQKTTEGNRVTVAARQTAIYEIF